MAAVAARSPSAVLWLSESRHGRRRRCSAGTRHSCQNGRDLLGLKALVDKGVDQHDLVNAKGGTSRSCGSRRSWGGGRGYSSGRVRRGRSKSWNTKVLGGGEPSKILGGEAGHGRGNGRSGGQGLLNLGVTHNGGSRGGRQTVRANLSGGCGRAGCDWGGSGWLGRVHCALLGNVGQHLHDVGATRSRLSSGNRGSSWLRPRSLGWYRRRARQTRRRAAGGSSGYGYSLC